MRIKDLKISGFTSLVEIELTNLPNLIVLIGKNSAGKSNLLNALSLLFQRFSTELDEDLGPIDNYHHLFPAHDTQSVERIRFQATLSLTAREWAYLLETRDQEGRKFVEDHLYIAKGLTVIDENLHWATTDVSLDAGVIVMDGEPLSEYPAINLHDLKGELLESDVDEIDFHGFMERLDQLLEVGFSVIRTSNSARGWDDPFNERPSIIPSDHITSLWQLSQSKGAQRQYWTKIAKLYDKLSPNQQRPAGVDSSVHLEEEALSVPIGMSGEGSQALLHLVGQLIDGPNVMAIEEPETHLHPGLVKQVGRVLAEIAESGKQLFICTHSPYLLSPASLDNFFVVKNEGNATTITSMKGKTSYKEALLHVGVRPSDIMFCDAILLVEGLSEDIFFNALSYKIGSPLADRYIKIVPTNGMPRGRHKIAFWSEVGRDAGIPIYLILDKNAQEEAEEAILDNHLPRTNTLILPQGDLEDCYPSNALQRALSEAFGKQVDEPIPAGERVRRLKKLLQKPGMGNKWKPELAEAVAKTITLEEAEAEMFSVVGFLRKMYNELGTD